MIYTTLTTVQAMTLMYCRVVLPKKQYLVWLYISRIIQFGSIFHEYTKCAIFKMQCANVQAEYLGASPQNLGLNLYRHSTLSPLLSYPCRTFRTTQHVLYDSLHRMLDLHFTDIFMDFHDFRSERMFHAYRGLTTSSHSKTML